MKRLDKGDRVAHQQYGAGTLTDVNEYHTVIDFDEHGVHKFITSMVMLEPTTIPAPERRRAAGKGTGRARTAKAKSESPREPTRTIQPNRKTAPTS